MAGRFKAWLLGNPTAVAPPALPATPVYPGRPPLAINQQALATARASKARNEADPMRRPAEEVYAPYKYAADVAPAEMAMDYAGGAMASLASWASSALFHEGQGFFGFPYLAELLQRAEYRHAAEIWAEHSVRKWIKFKGGTEAQIKAITAEFDRLDVRTVAQTWCYHDQAFGRGQIFLDFGDADKPAELATPLRLAKTKVSKKRPIQAIKAIEPVWSAPGVYETSNPLKTSFYKPADWIVYGKRVHHSRMLTMVSRPVSDMLKPGYAFGGLSLVQMMKPYVDNWLRARQSVSDMMNSYSILNLKTDLSATLAGGDCAEIFKRAELANEGRDNRGMWLTDKDSEELENIAVPLSGLDALQAQAQEQMASVARIPLSIYLQITPTGLNATNDGETRNFYADVTALQEKNMRPGLRTILDVVQLSLFDEIVDGLDFDFMPLWEMSDKDKADIRKADADADTAYVDSGVVSQEEVRERLSTDESSLYYGVDLTDPPPDQGNDGDGDENDGPFGNGVGQDEWNESDHPRDDDGKFGSGGGSSVRPSTSGAKTFAGRPTVWKSQRSGQEYVKNVLSPASSAEKAQIRELEDAMEDARSDTSGRFYEQKAIDPATLKTTQDIVSREQVLSVAAGISFNSESNGDLPLVVQTSEGLVLIDGNHRANAAIVAGEKLKVEIFNAEKWEAAQIKKPPAAKSGPDDDALLRELMG